MRDHRFLKHVQQQQQQTTTKIYKLWLKPKLLETRIEFIVDA